MCCLIEYIPRSRAISRSPGFHWRSGDGEEERCAVVQGAFHAHAAAVVQDNMLYDSQSQTGTTAVSGSGLIYAVKTLKNAGLVLGSDARPEIPDVEFHRDPIGPGP